MDSSFGSYPRFPIAAAHFVRQDLRAGQTVSVSRHAGMGHRHGLGTPERLSVKHNHRLGTREDMGEQRTSKPWIYELPSLRAHGRSCYVHVVFTFSDLPEQSRVHTCRPDLP